MANVKEKYQTHEIFMGIAYFLPGRRFHHDYEKLTEFFRKRRHEYSVLEDSDLNTHETGIREEMHHSHYVMSVAELLVSWGFNFNPHEFTEKCKRSFEEHHKPRFSQEQLGELERLAAEFSNEFCKPEMVRL